MEAANAIAAKHMTQIQAPNVKKLSRRQALLGALLAGATASRPAMAADASCSCLPAPDCNAICPNGGTPRGDGTQACDCIEVPQNVPPRALALVDGGDAVNATKWGGKQLRLNKNTSADKILVFDGDYVDYILKSEITGSLPSLGAAILYGTDVLVTTGSGSLKSNYTAVQRDDYGRVIKVGYWQKKYNCNCNCNCCNCGDDGGCFISAKLMTEDGFKSVKDIVPGDKLIGIDGIHPVVGVAVNTLGKRKAIIPKGHPDVLLTEEHIILNGHKLIVTSQENYERNKLPIEAANGVTGVYVSENLDSVVATDPTYFEIEEDLPTETPTYSPIVIGGCWAMTESGLSVLLCRKIDD